MLTFKMVVSLASGVLLLAGLGWSSHTIISERPTHQQVAQSLDEREFRRYEDLIQELKASKRNLEYVGRPLKSEELKQIKEYEDTIHKYEKRQEKLR